MEREMRREVRPISSKFTTREDGEQLFIEGYFAVFNSNYEIAPGLTESIAPGAFSSSLSNDVRALVNHDTTLVLGRTAAHTLELRQDEHGLWGIVQVNPKDTDAMNLYERVRRGDVDGCSFGFEIREEDTEFLPSGEVHWTIRDVNLFEVSCCTFPAYKDTNITAREHDRDIIRQRQLEAWKAEMKGRLQNGD